MVTFKKMLTLFLCLAMLIPMLASCDIGDAWGTTNSSESETEKTECLSNEGDNFISSEPESETEFIASESESSEAEPTSSEIESSEVESAPSEIESSEITEDDGEKENSEKKQDVTFVFDTENSLRGECSIVGIKLSKELYEKTEPWTLAFPSCAPTGELVTGISYTALFIPYLILASEFYEGILLPLQVKRDAGEISDFDYERFVNAWNRVDINNMREEVKSAYIQQYPFLDEMKVARKDDAGKEMVDENGTIEYDYPVFFDFYSYAGNTDKIRLSGMIADVGYTPFVFEQGWESHLGYIPYDFEKNAGCHYPESLVSISIPEGVRCVSQAIFYSFSALKIENGVAYADDWAVEFDPGFETVEFAEGTVGICDQGNSFIFPLRQSSMKKIIFPESLRSIGANAFEQCSLLENVTVAGESRIEYIGFSAFRNCKMLAEFVFPESLRMIEGAAFASCTSLKDIVIPEGVTSIGKRAFGLCSALESIVVDEGNHVYHSSGNCLIETEFKVLHTGCKNSVIPDDGSVTFIEVGAFEGCVGLVSIMIPDTVTIINPSAFSGCTSLVSVNIPTGVTRLGDSAFKGCSSLSGVMLPQGLEIVASDTFYGCSSLTSVTIPDNVTIIGDSVFSRCINLETVIISENSKLTSIGDSAFEQCGSLTSITIPKDVKTIEAYAFYDCSRLANVNVVSDSQLERIDERAFYGCRALTEIMIPKSVAFIGEEAFFSCVSLKGIGIPSSVTSIAPRTFENCVTLSSVVLVKDGQLASIAEGAFSNCISLEKIAIPNSVKSIGAEAFCGCVSLMSVEISASDSQLTMIDEKAFFDCYTLTDITIPKDVTTIGDDSFSRCYKLVEVLNFSSLSIQNGDTSNGSVGRYALNVYTPTDGYSKLWTDDDGYRFYEDEDTCYLLGYEGGEGDLILPATCHGKEYAIYKYAFRGSHFLKNVALSTGVVEIEMHAFYNCEELLSVTVSENLKNIGYAAFSGCKKLVSVTFLGESQLTGIEENAFFDCDGLTSITIPKGVDNIGANAFSSCSSMEQVFFLNNNGWECAYAQIAANDLSDSKIAAHYLTQEYASFDWSRVEIE